MKTCKERRLSLILAGDLFDERRPDSLTVGFATDMMKIMADAKLEVFFVQGQHDMAARPWLNMGTWPTHVNGRSFVIQGVQFYGMDFTPKDQLAEKLKEIPSGTDVLVAHQVWEEFMGRLRVCEGAIKDVPNVSMVITGDFHRHDQFKIQAADGRELLVVSPGSTTMRTIDEDPRKFFFIMNDDFTFESVPLVTRPLHLTRILNDETLEHCIQEVKKGYPVDERLTPELAKPIQVFEFYDNLTDAEKRLVKAVGDQAHLFLTPLRPKKEEEAEESIDAELLSGGLRSALMKDYDPKELTGATALRLYDSLNPKQELDQIVSEVRAADARWTVFDVEAPDVTEDAGRPVVEG